MKLNLPGRHLVVVGFWSDWGYLNDVLADAFSIATAASVTVVSPGDSASLETKAPLLWGSQQLELQWRRIGKIRE
jgi:hypothetical protein